MVDKAQDVMEVKDGRLRIDIALTKGAPSGSGKSTVFASTNGNVKINDDYVLGLNLYKKR